MEKNNAEQFNNNAPVSSENDSKKKTSKEEGGGKMTVMEWVRTLVIAFVIALAITAVVKPTIVKETSMMPNIQDGNYLFINKLAYWHNEPQKGDVIIFRSSLEGKKLLIKRVIGVPGDEIQISGGKVYINGREDPQNYTNDQSTNGNMSLKVKKGYYFCMGDNRLVSIDSRDSEVGPVPKKKIVGKAVFRLFPVKEIGGVDNPYK